MLVSKFLDLVAVLLKTLGSTLIVTARSIVRILRRLLAGSTDCVLY